MDLIGKMLVGRYEILEEIGKGGMANVYKGQDHFLNRYVAIKVLKEELRDDKEFVSRFNTEAQAAARITNPHVVSVYDAGFENGLYYIVMEYVEGITLKEYIAEHKSIPWKTAAEFAAQICDGLDAAHKQSVIHRDIKPQNIIITADNVLKVTDFGIARAATQGTITDTNSTIGTVHYLSPEQARGGFTNQRTDIYSLGVVLYEMLTGRLPFNDSTAVAIAIKHIQEKPILPRILNSDIPESVERIVMRAMNKEQDLRYETAEDLLNDLRAVIDDPNAPVAGDSLEDIEMTRKRDAINKDDINNYKKKHGKNTGESKEYREYADKVDKEMEERKLRDIDRKRAMREQKKKERKVTAIAIVAAVLVIAGLAFAFTMLSGGSLTSIFSGGDKIEVPNLIDMKLSDAQRMYKDKGFSIVGEEVESDKEAGTIIEQSPAASEKITKKSDMIIKVKVSKGNKNKTVLDYTGQKLNEAKKKIEESGFKVNVVEQDSMDIEKDIILKQEPAAGSHVADGALITIYVGKGTGVKSEEPKKETEKPKEEQGSSSGSSTGGTTGGGTSSGGTTGGGSSTGGGTTGGGTSSGGTTGGSTTGGGSSTGGGTTGGGASPGLSN